MCTDAEQMYSTMYDVQYTTVSALHLTSNPAPNISKTTSDLSFFSAFVGAMLSCVQVHCPSHVPWNLSSHKADPQALSLASCAHALVVSSAYTTELLRYDMQ